MSRARHATSATPGPAWCMNSECGDRGGHQMFSAVSAGFNQTNVIVLDWCVRCGVYDPNAKPHIVVNGQRREVDDVDPGEIL